MADAGADIPPPAAASEEATIPDTGVAAVVYAVLRVSGLVSVEAWYAGKIADAGVVAF